MDRTSTDEFVGTTIFNVSEGSISEFQLNRANQDVAGESPPPARSSSPPAPALTNAIHGHGLLRLPRTHAPPSPAPRPARPSRPSSATSSAAASAARSSRTELFYFANYERIKQTQAAAAAFGSAFSSSSNLSASQSAPYSSLYPNLLHALPRELLRRARLDYNGPFGGHYFVRGNDNINGNVPPEPSSRSTTTATTPGASPVGPTSAQARHHPTPSSGSYEKFHNFITDSTIGSTGLFDPIPLLAINYSTQNVHTGPKRQRAPRLPTSPTSSFATTAATPSEPTSSVLVRASIASCPVLSPPSTASRRAPTNPPTPTS